MRWMQAVAMMLAMFTTQAQAADRPSAELPGDMAHRIVLWPGKTAPGSNKAPAHTTLTDASDDPAVLDRSIIGIRQPYMVVHRPAHPNGTALLVAPGGGYARIVVDNEGSSLVPAFVDTAGITLFVLRYRLPAEGHVEARNVPLADAQRALRLIRAHAADYGIDPARVGVMGFSAGGHVAASLATRFDEPVYKTIDKTDALSARPDFDLLIYPVIDMGMEIAHAGSRERLIGEHPSDQLIHDYSAQNRVTARTPPTFLLATQDDDIVPVANTLVFHQALLKAGVPSELHVFPTGGHGFGVRRIQGQTVAAWPRLAIDWIASQTAKNATSAP
ncbi:Acetyl esterase/lipase [Pseudoxanthomonas sp. GM95]|uniref:alpha/beta hydrolase n=1 Tax=Pseudoxanthomonas sp. GM95 TaxID=1881043 RepID=UPI0008B369DC|nr:alpha/beta hydrolase [Pseudoxanthomonas sp. GM95]SEM23740.1 Acetyl esterase/lipase [Pseudoxanthomonas sp. GM95]